MRVCPKCGHVDPECWRPAAFHQHIDYAETDSLDVLDSDVFELIKDKKAGELVILEPFVYWKSARSNTVRRSWIEDFKIKGKSVPQERASHKGGDSINLLYVKHPKLQSLATTARNENE